ncbi:MAG: SusC/RagA family TonB-linked outer membrane protein [Prevotellaceae bacterium]|nr:SusC/RagA family TonB-linked outer membrane protein [Prevotellaceae bacterium]
MHSLIIIAMVCGCSISVVAQESRVTGKITDESGAPLTGASVVVKGTTNGVITDARGNYSITVSGAGIVLEISFLGYVAQDVNVGGRSVVDVALAEATMELEEVVVTALGVTREAKKLGYAVSTIKAADLTKSGATNFGTALYGKAPGVRIQTSGGGAAAGVSISVRGLSSLTGNNQPFVVIDGVPIRNGNTGSSGDYAEFGSAGRIRSNGLVDINPEDIESLTILKGASATALYGSEAANGVIMIKSKKASTGKLNVELTGQLMMNTIAYLPPIQDQYGPGAQSMYSGLDAEGFYPRRDRDGNLVQSLTYANVAFGPKYDGRDVLYFDGTIRPYKPYNSNPWNEFFRTGSNQIYSLAISSSSDKASTRFAYTFSNEVPNALTGNYNKHNFKLVGSFNLAKRFVLDYNANYIVQQFHNRAYSQFGTYNGFSGMFDTSIDIGQLKTQYQTSLGYRRENASKASLTPEESWFFNSNAREPIIGMLWGMFNNNINETDNRLISSVSPRFTVIDGLVLAGTLSTDLTNEKQTGKNNTERPIELFPTEMGGEFSTVSRRYNIYYGDVRLSFDKKLTDFVNINANLGWSGRKEDSNNHSMRTRGGLMNRNWFSLNASRETMRYGDEIQYSSMELLKQAWYGTLGTELGGWLFLEATGRQEKISTLKKGANTYFYPSVSTSFLYSEMLKDNLPSWYNLGKLRASYAIVGNAPGIYSANIAYNQNTEDGITFNSMPGSLGNENIVPEKKYEWEFGIENKLFNNRLGFEFSYYMNDIKDMILGIPQPITSGVSSILVNAAQMSNKGWEFSVYGTPVQTKDFSWTLYGNISRNRNSVISLAPGIDYLGHGASGNHGGGLDIRSYAGQPAGDIYAQVYETDAAGNYLTDNEGWYYNKDGQTLHRVGNAMPKFVGGLGTSLNYKNWTLDVMTDFRIGGDVANVLWHLSTAEGLTPETLKYRDEASGGLAFYEEDGTGAIKPARHSDAAGPAGEVIYHNGVIQPGIRKSDGQPNTSIVPSDYMYYYTYNWGTDTQQMSYANCVSENTYWKMREIALGYKIPESFTRKIGINNLTLSVFGRNLFYMYKTIKDYDVETAIGTSWVRQASIDGGTSPTRTFGFSFRMNF